MALTKFPRWVSSMRRLAAQPVRFSTGAVLVLWSGSALAHGEQYLVAGAAALSIVCGSVFGVAAGFWRPATFGVSFVAFLAIGALVAWVAAGSDEGATLFLVFGGIAGAIPFAAGYFALRVAVQWLRRMFTARVRARDQTG